MQIMLFDSPTYTRPVLDLTPYTRAGTITHGPHGDEESSFDLRIPMSIATQLFRNTRTPAVVVMEGGQVVYAGRVEEIEIGADGTKLPAYGYWRALADVPYTALWSHSGTADWRPLRGTETTATATPGHWQTDVNNRLYITLVKNSVIPNNTAGALAYRLPDGGSRVATRVDFSYTTVLPSGFALRITWYSAASGNASWTAISGATVITGSGTGSVTQTLTGSPVAVDVRIANLSGSSYTVAAETDAFYAMCTNVRVTSQATPILASNIAADMVSVVSALNATQLSSSTARIAATTIDRFEEVYEDADMRQILERLALAEGDYVVGVDRDRRLYLYAPGTFARTWVVERADLRLTRILDDVTNSAYGVYQESDGYALRTAMSANNNSVARYGVTRRTAVSASQTTSSSVATTIRDAYLADNATPPPRAAITIPRDGLATESGARAPGWLVQSGDTLRIRQLPPGLAIALDQLSTFRVGRRTYDLATGVTTIEPLNAPDTLTVYLAQRENRNKAIIAPARGEG